MKFKGACRQEKEPKQSLIPGREIKASRVFTIAKPDCRDRLALAHTGSFLLGALPVPTPIPSSHT